MRLSEAHLRQLVRSILLEAGKVPPPDEPGVEPDEALGRYVFPKDRINASKYRGTGEKNTQLEDEFFQALKGHYYSNDPGLLRNVWPQILELERQGLYTNILRPPGGKVYRLMKVSPYRAAQFLGLPESEISTRAGEAQVAPNPPPYRPREFLSSWTLDPRAMIKISEDDFIKDEPGSCSLIFVADTRAGEFLMNPDVITSSWKVGMDYAHEREVIGGGEIPIETAAWMWHGPASMAPPHKLIDTEMNAAYKELYNKEMDLRISAENEEDPNAVRAKEFDLWSKFIYRIVGVIRKNIPDSKTFETMGNGIMLKLLAMAGDPDEFESFAGGKQNPAWMDIASRYVMSDLTKVLEEYIEYDNVKVKAKSKMASRKILDKLMSVVTGGSE